MKLYIDTSNSKNITVALDSKKYQKKLSQSQELLSLIDKALGKSHKTVKDITEIQINRGPGSFTGLRVGASVANALGWMLDIPVNGQDVKKEGSVEPNYQ